MIIALMWILVLPLAALSQRWVELPAVGLGKRLATGLDMRHRRVPGGEPPDS